jgi:hypothetical protein
VSSAVNKPGLGPKNVIDSENTAVHYYNRTAVRKETGTANPRTRDTGNYFGWLLGLYLECITSMWGRGLNSLI